MILAFSIGVAVLFGAGAYLVLSNDLVRLVAGIVIISQSAVLVVLASGLARGYAPILPLADEPASDPLVQAMALTAIVIGVAVTALLLAIVARARAAQRSLEVSELAREEDEQASELERTLGAMGEAPGEEEAEAE